MTIIVIIIIRETGMSVKSRQWFLLVAGAFKEPCSLSVHMIHTLHWLQLSFCLCLLIFFRMLSTDSKEKKTFFLKKRREEQIVAIHINCKSKNFGGDCLQLRLQVQFLIVV